MEYKLIKTYLSDRPSRHSLLLAFIGLASLLLFFEMNPENLIANGEMIFNKKEYWRAFTTTLLHGDLNHLAHNAFFFTGLAMLLHHYFGFWIFPILSLLVGGLINFVVLSTYPPHVSLVGVSGVIYFMASFWLTLYILIERRQSLTVRFVHAISVSLIFLFPEAFRPQTSYLAHGVGFVFGIPFGLSYYFFNRKKIRSKDKWIELKKESDDENDIIFLDENSYHQVTPEEGGPTRPV